MTLFLDTNIISYFLRGVPTVCQRLLEEIKAGNTIRMVLFK